MDNYFVYIINVSICISLFYTLYFCFFRKSTLFTTNRIYLLLSLLISLIIPLFHLQLFNLTTESYQPVFKQFFIASYVPEEFLNAEVAHQQNIFAFILSPIYFGGVILMLFRYIYFILKIRNLVRAHQVIKIEKTYFVLMNKNLSPFSFFHFIFIDKSILNNVQMEPAIEHEKIHARELHSLDLLIVQLITAFLWFNPFVFLFSNSIKENHEYQADAKAIQSGIDPLHYLTKLANEVFIKNLIGLTSNFNCSTIKKRLIMITKIKSSKKEAFRLLFLLPLICLLLVAFSKPNNAKIKLLKFINTSTVNKTSDIPCIMPVQEDKIQTTSGYGWRTNPKLKIKQFHTGIDLKASEGTSVLATADGTVIKCEYSDEINSFGKTIFIKHNTKYSTFYAHLSEIKVKNGDQVKQGMIIGLVGNSGLSTGPHLHYEVFKDGKNTDPKEYFK